jgi:hypothetical protein
VQSDGLQIETGGEVDGSDDVLERGHDARWDLTVLCIGRSRRSRNAVRVGSILLCVPLRGRWGQLRAVGVRERAGSHELREKVRTTLTKTRHHESLPSEPGGRWTGGR